jgi:ketosteroid isomerase-like protein
MLMQKHYSIELLTLLVALVGLLAGCQRKNRSEVERAIRNTDEVCEQGAEARDIDKALTCYADTASMLPPNAPIATGKDAMRKVWARMIGDPTSSLSWQTTKLEVSQAGDMVYSIGTYEFSTTDPAGRRVADHGKGVAIYQRQPDGKWRVVVDIFNSDLSPPQAPGALAMRINQEVEHPSEK